MGFSLFSSAPIDVAYLNLIFNLFSVQIFYLCAYWLWSNWIFYIATKDAVAHSLAADDVAAQRASKTVYNLMECMHWVSRVWTVNHGIRVVTTLAMATSDLRYFVQEYDDSVVWTVASAL